MSLLSVITTKRVCLSTKRVPKVCDRRYLGQTTKTHVFPHFFISVVFSIFCVLYKESVFFTRVESIIATYFVVLFIDCKDIVLSKHNFTKQWDTGNNET